MIYFAYGSNMETLQMQTRCPSATVIGIGKMSHYTLAFTRWSHAWKSATADILPERGGEVYGVLYDLSPTHLKKMDQAADYPSSYVRQDVWVVSLDRSQHGAGDSGNHHGPENTALPALTYLAVRQGVFLPSKTYLGKIISGAEQHEFPTAYIAFLKGIPTQEGTS